MMQVKWPKNYNKPRWTALFKCEIEYLYHFYTLFCHFDCQGSV